MKVHAAAMLAWSTMAVVSDAFNLPHSFSYRLNHQAATSLSMANDVPDIVKAYGAKRAVGQAVAEVDVKLPEPPAEAVVVDTTPAPPAVDISIPDASTMTKNAQPAFDAVDKFVKSARDNMEATKASAAFSTSPANVNVPNFADKFQKGYDQWRENVERNAQLAAQSREASTVPAGKAPLLTDFLKSGSVPHGVESDQLVDAKSKLALLVANTYHLFGQDPPAGYDSDLASTLINNPPEGAVGWAVVGGAVLLAAAANSGNTSPTTESSGSTESIADASSLDLSGELQSVSSDIQKLKDVTAELSTELKTAKTKLNEKELEISRLRLTAAEKELELNREIQRLSLKLDEAIKLLGSQAKAIPEPELPPVTKAAIAKQVTIDEPDVISILKDQADKTASSAKKPKASPKGAKGAKSPAKVAASPKKKKSAPSSPAAKAAPVKKAPAKKAAAKKAPAKKKAAPTSSSDLTSLSKSTLSRKTVKELSAFLEGKGVKTKGADGKALKKAELVEAVLAL